MVRWVSGKESEEPADGFCSDKFRDLELHGAYNQIVWWLWVAVGYKATIDTAHKPAGAGALLGPCQYHFILTENTITVKHDIIEPGQGVKVPNSLPWFIFSIVVYLYGHWSGYQ